jgi:hypothetical protein
MDGSLAWVKDHWELLKEDEHLRRPDFWIPPGLAFIAFFAWLYVARWKLHRSGKIGDFVGRALAGICLLDTAFACLFWGWFGLLVLLFLPLCLLLQRRIAAT